VTQLDIMISRAGQRGFSLVELMIGLTIGLLLLSALAYFFLGSRQVGRTHNDMSRMQESGRTALYILGAPIRQAGARASPLVAFSGTPLTGTEGGGNPDAITVSYEVQDGGEADCMGNTVASGTVTYVFAVDAVHHTLTCSNGAVGAVPVVVMDNIDDMQIMYGIDTNGDGAIDSYQTATGLVPAQVAAVRISLLVRGATDHIATGDTQTYTYNGAAVTATDGVLRQIYTSTFTVRNLVKGG
jgi:type IV pilus assembly protein PilW